jgi:hypothetical protein
VICDLSEAIQAGGVTVMDSWKERSVMGDKSQKDKNKGLKQKAAKEAKKEKKRRAKQERASDSNALIRQ